MEMEKEHVFSNVMFSFFSSESVRFERTERAASPVYSSILSPPISKTDIAHWLNVLGESREQDGQRTLTINTAGRFQCFCSNGSFIAPNVDTHDKYSELPYTSYSVKYCFTYNTNDALFTL